jgi:two-component system CheB/CheR fusion protein
MAFIVVSHLAPERESLLVEILGRNTSLPVLSAKEGEKVQADHIYVIPPGRFMTIEAGYLRLTEAKKRTRPPNTIDVFFSALAADAEDSAIGIVLSGAGSDGALGIKAIKEKGGLTLAQGIDHTPLSHSSMPNSAISTGLVDYVLPPEDMIEKISAYLRAAEPVAQAVGAKFVGKRRPDARLKICQIIREQISHDFSGYKPTTFIRRVQRRMQVLQIDKVDAYIETLQTTSGEVAALFRDLLIGVTYFFRDPEAFSLLEHNVVPALFEGKNPSDVVRVWVPGCATGEEVYSIAMLLCEHASTLARPPKISVFGTDLDESALSIARQARYPATILKDVSAQRLDRHFVGDGVTYVVKKEIRDACIFSIHNVIQDPPFSRIDMISCRNLLIYMGNALQQQVVPVFHYALRTGGVLFLGLSESVSQHAELFAPLDKKSRIFQRLDHVAPATPLPIFLSAKQGQVPRSGDPPKSSDSLSLRRSVDNYVIEHLAPAHVVVDRAGNLVHASARTGNYLELAAGQPNRYLLSMARKGIRVDLRNAMDEALERMAPATRERVQVDVGGRSQLVNLIVRPLPAQATEPLFLVAFEDAGAVHPEKKVVDDGGGAQDATIEQQLEHEIRDARERLQSMMEEYETSLEETKSANEELVSLNEELQSTNEELETSKEEIQSVNEELQTVNLELQSKIGELDTANSDLRNLFESTRIAIVFLDNDLKIRSFTPEVTKLFNLIQSDRGRPLTDIASRFQIPELKTDIEKVRSTGETVERRIDDGADAQYLMRVLPYLSSGHLDGVLVTVVDVSRVMQAEAHLRTLVHELNHRVRNMLTVVSAMARQTARRTRDPAAFIESFSGRLNAMAKAYDVVSSEHWNNVDLATLIESQIQPYTTADSKQWRTSGSAVSVRPKAAIAIGMVVHELTTNAIKYGALSVQSGWVDITWVVEPANGADVLLLRWTEHGGPVVTKPKVNGFGTTLIERELEFELNGAAAIRYDQHGVKAEFRIPLEAELLTIGAQTDERT